MAGIIQFTSVITSQSLGSFYVVNPGPNSSAVNGNPASLALTGTVVTCTSTSVACGQETLTVSAFVSGLTIGDLVSIGLDGTWSGGPATTLQWTVSGFGVPLDTGVQNATSSFDFPIGPFAISKFGSFITGTFVIDGLGAGQSVNLPKSAIVNVVTPDVPEPASVALMAAGFGAMALGAWRRRRRQKS
jgi:hypothetical protein